MSLEGLRPLLLLASRNNSPGERRACGGTRQVFLAGRAPGLSGHVQLRRGSSRSKAGDAAAQQR